MADKPKRVQVVVVDDHPVFREGVVRALASAGLQVVAECSDGRDALAQVTELRPDVVLLDYKLPELSCFRERQRRHLLFRHCVALVF